MIRTPRPVRQASVVKGDPVAVSRIDFSFYDDRMRIGVSDPKSCSVLIILNNESMGIWVIKMEKFRIVLIDVKAVAFNCGENLSIRSEDL